MNQGQADVTVQHRFALRARPTRTEQLTVILPPPLEPLCRPEDLAAAHRLVARRDAGLGDCLMILPTLGAIRQRFPHLAVTFQAPAAYTDLLAGFAEVDEAVPLNEPSPGGAEAVFADLSNYMERHPQAWLVPRIDLISTAFGIPPLPRAARYAPSPAVQQQAQAWLARHSGRRSPHPQPLSRRERGERDTALQAAQSRRGRQSRQECRSYDLRAGSSASAGRTPRQVEGLRVGIALRGIYGHRSWLIPYVFELAQRLAALNWEVLIFDANPDAPQYPWADAPDRPGPVACAYGLALPVVAALLASCDAAVVPDTGLLHLAACTGTPFVAIFGAIPPELRLNYYDNFRCLTAQGRVPCVPCCEGPQHIRCRYECLWAITPEEVELALHELLAKTSAEHRQTQITG